MIEGVLQGTSQEVATFRDPAGSLSIRGEQVLRTVNPRHAPACLHFLRSALAQEWTSQGHLIQSEVVSAGENQPLVLQHPRVFFPSYPWEWSAGQWVAAAELTLELFEPKDRHRLVFRLTAKRGSMDSPARNWTGSKRPDCTCI